MPAPIFTTQLVAMPSPELTSLQEWLTTKFSLSSLPSYAWHQLNQTPEPLTIDLVRQLQAELAFAVASTTVYILWNVDTASPAAQNALLKMVEEPPTQVLLVLVAQSLDGVLPTLQSRAEIHTLAATSLTTAELPFELDTLTPAQVLEWVETVEDRAEGLSHCENYLQHLIAQPKLSRKHLAQLKLLKAAWQDLKLNLNVALTLEHHFLAISMLNKAHQ